MNNLFNFPLRIEDTAVDDVNLVDANNQVLIKLNWKNDPDHIAKQKSIGTYIISALTLVHEDSQIPHALGTNFCSEDGTKGYESNLSLDDLFMKFESKNLNYTDSKKLRKVKMFFNRLERKYRTD